MGGDFEVGTGKDPLNPVGANTDMIHALSRLEHVEELLPEICTLDCGSLNFGDSNMTFIHTPIQLRTCLLYTSPSPRDGLLSRMPSSA